MEEISRFIVENAWSLVALLPAVIVLVMNRALKGTRIAVNGKPILDHRLDRRWLMPLGCSLLDSNDKDRKWGVK